jgi:hypothetical protein
MDLELDLFGEVLKTEGIALVASHNEDYIARFHGAAASILSTTGEVTSEDVIAVIGMPSGSPNAVGAAMRSFATANNLAVSHYRKAKRPSCHAAIIGVWTLC